MMHAAVRLASNHHWRVVASAFRADWAWYKKPRWNKLAAPSPCRGYRTETRKVSK